MNASARRVTIPTGGGAYTIDAANVDTTLGQEEFVYNGSGTLSGSVTISPVAIAATGVPYKVRIRWNATFELDGNNVTIFSQVLSAEQARGGNTLFECLYIANAWTVCVIDSDTIEAKTNDGVKVTTLTGAGGTTTLDPKTDYTTQVLEGSGNLAANYVFQGGGSPINGDKFRVIYNATFGTTGSDITIFGHQLTDSQILYGGYVVDAEYTGTTWKTAIFQNPDYVSAGIDEVFVIPVSFDTNEYTTGAVSQCAWFPGFGGETVDSIPNVYGSVTKLIEASNDATAELCINGVATGNVLTFTAGDAIATWRTGTFAASWDSTDILSWKLSKTTAGGKALISIPYKRT